ncbi:unnamed protein product [Urochloa decumbens]|uniref:LRAT domain-containing protein n=1 Tax=Urochloa decumbens TaxID=240449 RepID=A0ABC9B104_9POAL
MDRGVTVASSRIERWQLRPGDHIYAWRSTHAYAFPHHGIYESHTKVIHFKAPLEESSSFIGAAGNAAAAKAKSYAFCRECHEAMRHGGVVWCCLECFLEGDNLCLFAYSVPLWFYTARNIGEIANRARFTCTTKAADPPEKVLERAKDMLARNGFGTYNALVNNCFDFAVFCKTGGALVSPARAPILEWDQQLGPGHSCVVVVVLLPT